MRNSSDVIVIGAGIVGAAAARALAAAGRRVLVLRREGAAGEATTAAAGMLAPQIETHADDPMLPLAIAAREYYRDLAAQLGEAGHDIGYRPDGILHVACDEAGARDLEAQAAAQRSLGLEAEYWDRAELERRVPGIGARVVGGAFAPRDGHVDNVALAGALVADAQRLGAEVRNVEVDALTVMGGSVTGVRGGDESFLAPVVVLAAGAWAPAIGCLPRPLPIAPVRGQMALAPWPAGEEQRVIFGPGAYLVPRGDYAVLGSTMEQAGFAPETTAEGIAHIRTATGMLFPPLLTYPIVRTWAGLRPVTPDGRPIIGRDPDVAGLVYACGHGRNGILLGPLTGEIVRDLVVTGETRWDLAPYAVSRFKG